MFNRLISKLSALAVVALAGVAFAGMTGTALAQSQTVNYTASVTVQNTFNVGMTTPLTFGTVAAVSDTTTVGTQAQIVLQANSGTTAVTQGAGGNASRLLSIVAPTPGVIAIDSAPPSTAITITNGSQISLSNPADANAPGFFFTPSAVAAGFNNTTSAAGALTVNVGGTLTTKQQVTNAYSDGTYTGSFSVTFAF
ncbi:MAG: hypothetical protein RID42_10900 [Alphaproteobacteria bacterium]